MKQVQNTYILTVTSVASFQRILGLYCNIGNFCQLSAESEPTIEGVLVDDHTLVANKEMQSYLEQRGYGETSDAKFFLKPFESLYFLFYNKLVLTKSKQKIGFDQMLQVCNEFDQNALTKFLIYRDLRVRGYAVKDGFGFGSDFRVYERGQFGEKGAKYLVFGLAEGKQEKIGQLQKNIQEITKMGKEPILAVIERRGEVIYYKVSNIRFLENTKNIDSSGFVFG
jgi:tRNA-intron endonuclease